MAWIEAAKRRLHRDVLALSGKGAHGLAFALKTKTLDQPLLGRTDCRAFDRTKPAALGYSVPQAGFFLGLKVRTLGHNARRPGAGPSGAAKPVALEPGRAKLSTMPPPTGSATLMNTIGTVRVVRCTAEQHDEFAPPGPTQTSPRSNSSSVTMS